jgi:glycerophosphoryl diester phosphodiesterase
MLVSGIAPPPPTPRQPWSQFARSSWLERRQGAGPLVIGHRGASAHEAENSVAAFRRAAADGADGVELDVLACATGDVVVFHDDDLGRLGGRPERIDSLSLAALRDVRLASGASIPTLEEALEACGPRMLVNVELKAPVWGARGLGPLCDRVASVVSAAGASGRVLVSSFNPWAVGLWQRRAPSVPAGLLFEREAPLPLRRAWALPWLRPLAVHPERVLCSPDTVTRWRRRGYRVHVWTADDPGELRRLRDLGVDAVIANDPARARAVLEGSG